MNLATFGLGTKPQKKKWKPKKGTPLAPTATQGNTAQAKAEQRYGGRLPVTHVFFTTHEGGVWSYDEIQQKRAKKQHRRRRK